MADQEKNNVAIYGNRYRDNIGAEVIMEGDSWFRYDKNEILTYYLEDIKNAEPK